MPRLAHSVQYMRRWTDLFTWDDRLNLSIRYICRHIWNSFFEIGWITLDSQPEIQGLKQAYSVTWQLENPAACQREGASSRGIKPRAAARKNKTRCYHSIKPYCLLTDFTCDKLLNYICNCHELVLSLLNHCRLVDSRWLNTSQTNYCTKLLWSAALYFHTFSKEHAAVLRKFGMDWFIS